MHRRVVFGFAIAVMTAVGCGDDTGGPSDGSVTSDASFDGSTVEVAMPALPEPPALPNFLPCPDGWREVPSEDGVTLCEPWPESGRQDCPAGEAHFVGTPGCAPVGDPCPAGDWPEDLPTGRRVWYVRPGGTGDGSISAPLGSPEAAFMRAADGDVIALSKGTHGRVPLLKSLEVIGACAAETRIATGTGNDWALLVMGAATATLRNVTVGPTWGTGVVTSGTGASFTARGVVFEDTHGGAIIVGLGSSATLERVRVRNVIPDSTGRSFGLTVQDGSPVTADQITIEGAQQDSILVHGAGTTLRIDRGATWGSAGVKPGCLVARNGATVTGAALSCEDAGRSGILGSFGGATFDLTHVVVRRVSPGASGSYYGRGVVGQGRTDMTLSKALIEEATQIGLVMGDEDASLETTSHLSDVVIRRTAVDEARLNGSGLVLNGASTSVVERLLITDTHFDGLLVQLGGWLDATDVTILRTTPTPAGGNGPGLLVSNAGGAFERVEIGEATAAGAVFQWAEATVRDLTLRSTRPNETGRAGFGVVVTTATELTGQRWLVEGSRTSQINVQSRATALLSDITLRAGLPEEDRGIAGYGLQAVNSRFELTRASIEGHRGFGVLVTGAMGDPSTLRDVVLAGTQATDCAECFGHGSGLGVFRSEVAVTGFSLRDNAVCGVLVGVGGGVDLSMGEVVGSAIGACVEDDGYDLSRLQGDVHYQGNETNLDSTSLPVPDPAVAPEFSER